MPSHLVFRALIYPLCGVVLAYATSRQNALQLLVPIASGLSQIDVAFSTIVTVTVAVGVSHFVFNWRRISGLDSGVKGRVQTDATEYETQISGSYSRSNRR